MNAIRLEDFSKATLIELVKMYSRNWQTLDGLWFGNVEAECGLEAAVRIDLQNWQKQALLEAKRLKKILNLEKGGLSSILTVLSMMSWQLTSPQFEVEYQSNEKIIFYYSKCAVQESRKSNHKPVFPCKQMKMTLLKNIAQEIEPQARVKCLDAPPNKKTGRFWCKWELSIPK